MRKHGLFYVLFIINIMKNITLYVLIMVWMTGCSGGSKDGWTDLFNGKDLIGWIQLNGEAEFRVENREIIGISKADTPNSFICKSFVFMG